MNFKNVSNKNFKKCVNKSSARKRIQPSLIKINICKKFFIDCYESFSIQERLFSNKPICCLKKFLYVFENMIKTSFNKHSKLFSFHDL